MKSLYPQSFADIRTWAADTGTTVLEARIRFAQFSILRAIASSRALSSALVLKGGNALDFVWQPNRSTIDLDFSVDMEALDQPLSEGLIRRLLEPALGVSTPSRSCGGSARLSLAQVVAGLVVSVATERSTIAEGVVSG